MGWCLNWTSLDPMNDFKYCDNSSWWHKEPEGLPRVSTGVKNRVDRLKAIGNGQVPLVVATAWKILMSDK